MKSSPTGPYVQGYSRRTMADTKGGDTVRWSQSQKTVLNTNWRLQLESTQAGTLVIAYQHAAVNTLPRLVHTARQTTRVEWSRDA